MPTPRTDRRDFLKSASIFGGAAAAPYFFSTPRAFADEMKSANDRPNIGVVGCGGIAAANMTAAKNYVNVVALADVDSKRLRSFNKKLAGGKAATFGDYRDVIHRDDVDVVHVATPDHWHTKPLVEAMLAGKDVYCEKPLTLTIDEGNLIRRVQQETGRVVQVGTQQRSTFDLFVKAIALVAEGRLGKIRRLEAAIGSAPSCGAIPVVKPPKELNWDKWLGPAPEAEYRFLAQEQKPVDPNNKKNNRRAREVKPHTNGHYQFRWWYEYSGGKLTDWGAHHVDIAIWALQANGQPATPLSVGGTAEHPVDFVDGVPVQKDRYNTATRFNFVAKFPGDVELVIKNESNGVLIEGDKGRIFVNRGKLTGKPVEELAENPLPEGALQRAYRGLPILARENGRRAHWANFLHCVKTRDTPISDVTSHMEALNVCHLAGISARLGRTVNWDAEAGKIPGDDVANAMLARPYRKGYEIEV